MILYWLIFTFVSNVDSLDWKSPGEDNIFKKVINSTSKGSILLFHNSSKQTPRALEGIIKELKKKGYSFVKVSDLIYKNNYYIDHTGKQRPMKK